MPKQTRTKAFFHFEPRIACDANTKHHIQLVVDAINARHKKAGQHQGPITRAYEKVLKVLLFDFHNSKTGRCDPSHRAIAKKARCCRDTVIEALKVLEELGVLTWCHRLIRRWDGPLDWFGKPTLALRRTSNGYLLNISIVGNYRTNT